jgi:hypothetical protein
MNLYSNLSGVNTYKKPGINTLKSGFLTVAYLGAFTINLPKLSFNNDLTYLLDISFKPNKLY